MRRALMILILVGGLPLTVLACLWDRDTPAEEAEGMPEVVAVITGRFPRNPPLFYEMRLARVAQHLRSEPEDLAAYDDAGVACDRLGRGDEAIEWMKRKREQLESLPASDPAVKEQWYRYHANLGTFLVHRWARQGSDRAKIAEVEQARDEIAEALKINPEAHFGREKYQLKALEWIIAPPELGPYGLPTLVGWPTDTFSYRIEPQVAHDAVKGLAGLIVLGNAWESIDVFHALDLALQHDTLGFSADRDGGRNSLAYLARLRCFELIDDGKCSILPGAPTGENLKRHLLGPTFIETSHLDQAYPRLRAEAEAWQRSRTEFMLERLKAGRHPDTDPNFWAGYREAPAPALPSVRVPDTYTRKLVFRQRMGIGLLIGILLSLGAIALFFARRHHKQQKHQEEIRFL